MKIQQFIGTCSSNEIGQFAEKNGRKSSWETAKKAIKKYDQSLYNELSLDFKTYYEEYTNIKQGSLFGNKGKYLHIIHSAVDYIFLLETKN
jgi:succinylglutamate desuccinylase